MKTKKLSTKYFEPLDEEERELMESLEKDEWIPVPHMEEEMKIAREAAKNTLARLKNKNINIRVSNEDHAKLKSKAEENGLHYQTIVSTLIHQYVNDKIKVTI